MKTEDGLKPCRRCGSECRVQTFPANGALQMDTTVWLCANSIRLGGQCDEDAYLTQEAWNAHAEDEYGPDREETDDR